MVYATVTLTGKITFSGQPAAGRAVLTPTVNSVSDMAGNEVLAGPLYGVLDSTGAFSIDAPATDDVNLRPQNFGYTLDFELDKGTLPGIPEFSLPTAQATLDLTDIIPNPANPTYVPTLEGPANTLTVGTVTTGAPGTAAVVDITGQSPNQTINFTIPQGTKGDTGATGPANTLAVGTVSSVPNGTPPDVTISGVSPNQTLDFVLEAGPQGPQGPKGDPGQGSISTVNGDAGPDIVLDKTWVGLDQVDNTSDVNKPVSTAQQTAIDRVLGTVDTDISEQHGLISEVHTRSTTLTYTGSDLTQVVEKSGATTVKTTDLGYDASGNLSTVTETVNGKTITTTLNYDAGTGDLTSVTRSVV